MAPISKPSKTTAADPITNTARKVRLSALPASLTGMARGGNPARTWSAARVGAVGVPSAGTRNFDWHPGQVNRAPGFPAATNFLPHTGQGNRTFIP